MTTQRWLMLVGGGFLGWLCWGIAPPFVMGELPPPTVALASWIIPALLGGGSFFGGLFGNKKQTSTQTNMPTMDPAYGPLQSMLMSQIMQRMRNPSALPSGYEAGQISNINNTYGLVNQGLENRLTARGLGSSPVAGAGLATMEQGRAGDIVRMQQQIPLLNRQLQTDDLNQAIQMMNLGRGNTATTTQPGNMVAGGATSLANMLAFLYGPGAFGGPSATSGG